jgi:hypothetical protein
MLDEDGSTGVVIERRQNVLIPEHQLPDMKKDRSIE